MAERLYNTRMFRTLYVVLLAALVSWNGCSHRSSPQEDVLVVARAGGGVTLDPGRVTDVDSMDVIGQVYETLVKYAPGSFEIEPCLAVSWTSSTDLKVWTFHLRRGVRFHDGTVMDADAVVYSFLRQARGGGRAKEFVYWNSSFADIVQDVQRVDAHTVRFVLTRPFAPFLASLAMLPVAVVSPAAARRHGDDLDAEPVGTGPFKVVSRDRENGIVVLDRFDGYWGKKASVRRIVFKKVPDAKHRLLALESGSAHVIRNLDPVTVRLVRLHPQLRVLSTVANSVTYLVLNTSKPPFNNPYARWAVSHAIRKDLFVKLIFQGLADPAIGPLPPGITWAFTRNVKRYLYDPERAKRELAAAGYRDDLTSRPLLLVMDAPRPYMPRPRLAAAMIARDLERVGMPVNVVARPFKDFKAAMARGEHALAIYGWVGDTGDPDNFLYTLLSPKSPLNMAFWKEAEFSELVEAAREASDREERARSYKRAQQLVMDEAPWVPLAYPRLVAAATRRVSGVELHPTGILRLARARFK